MNLTQYEVLRRPLMTEKCARLKEEFRQVVLEAAVWANKSQIKSAAEKLFSVKVSNVRTSNVRGKTKRVGKGAGKQRNWKKAVLTLVEGSDLDVFGVIAAVPTAPEGEA